MNNHDNSDEVADPADTTAPLTAMPADTRGILDPAEMMRRVAFERFPAPPALDGLVDWCWAVAWDLPEGARHEQEVLSHPAGNVSIGTTDETGRVLDPAPGRVFGVTTGLSRRVLTGRGWNVAARTSVGGLGVLLDAPASTVTDRQVDLAAALPGLPAEQVLAEVRAAEHNGARVQALQAGLEELVRRRDPAALAEAREVVAVAALAERDRQVCRVEQLAAAAGASVRTLQRLFDTHVGVGPSFVIRRWRLIEAAEAARRATDEGDGWRGWAAVAAELGYADQAHLTRDFRRHLGTSPAAYLARAARPR